MRISDETLVVRVGDLFHEEDESLFFLKESSDELFELNSTASFVWKKIEQPITFLKLLELLLDEFSVQEEIARADLIELLDLLHKKNLITYSK